MDCYSHSNGDVSWPDCWQTLEQSQSSSCDSGCGTESEDWRKELTGCVPGWPTTWQRVQPNPQVQERHQMKREWPSHVLEAEVLAQRMLYPRKPENPVSSYVQFNDIPFQWVEITGFPWAATEQILKSFHCVGTILKKRPIWHGIQLQYASTVEACRALEFNSVTISGYKVRVDRLLDDPEERAKERMPQPVTSYSHCWQNPQETKFSFREMESRCRERQSMRNCKPCKESCFWGFCVKVAYFYVILSGLLSYCFGYLWLSLDNWMKSRIDNRNEDYPDAGYHCDLVNLSVNRHVRAKDI